MSNNTPPSSPLAPSWDLTDLYPAMDHESIAADLSFVTTQSKDFSRTYKDKISQLDGHGLLTAIYQLEKIEDVAARLISYAYLNSASDLTHKENRRFLQKITEELNLISNETVFFTLELCSLSNEHVNVLLASSPDLATYATWISNQRAKRDYTLNNDLEQFLNEKNITSKHAWKRLFDEHLAQLKFTVEDTPLSLQETLTHLTDPDRTKRQRAGQALEAVFKENSPLSTTIFNTLVKDKEIENKWRGYPDVATSQHLENAIEPEVVDALVKAVRTNYASTAHRYYALKAKQLGVDKLEYWDRIAPFSQKTETLYSWDQAQKIVLDAYKDFSPALQSIGQQFFDSPWIDAAIRPGKVSGAFAHPTTPSCHPYLLVNFQGKINDIKTLAHELGHGIHQVLASGQGPILFHTPLTLAETASVFGEELTFNALLNNETDKLNRQNLLASRIEDKLNTVARQISFYIFERTLHLARQKGELSTQDINNLWRESQSECLGPSFNLTEGYGYFWSYIPHFIRVPFYVYAYAFGECLVNSLYAVYQEQPDGFPEKYQTLLAAGGSQNHQKLLAPFGLDATQESFWEKGLSVIKKYIDDLEETL